LVLHPGHTLGIGTVLEIVNLQHAVLFDEAYRESDRHSPNDAKL
jgi:hypothetical protein